MIEEAWVWTEALRLAKNAVKLHIRDRGLRLNNFAAKDITKLDELWFDRHKAELIGQATITLMLRRSKLESDAQKSKAPESRAWAVRISRELLIVQSPR